MKRHEMALKMGRELAQRLAVAAEKVAVTFDQLACIHEAMADEGAPPLAGAAAERAIVERRMAARERAASFWFNSIADGSMQRATERLSGCRPSRPPAGSDRRPAASR